VPGEEVIVAERISEEVMSALANSDGCQYSLSDRKRQGVAALLKWPD